MHSDENLSIEITDRIIDHQINNENAKSVFEEYSKQYLISILEQKRDLLNKYVKYQHTLHFNLNIYTSSAYQNAILARLDIKLEIATIQFNILKAMKLRLILKDMEAAIIDNNQGVIMQALFQIHCLTTTVRDDIMTNYLKLITFYTYLPLGEMWHHEHVEVNIIEEIKGNIKHLEEEINRLEQQINE